MKLSKMGILIGILILICSDSVLSQSQKINMQRMNRDLKIMEGILDKVLDDHDSSIQYGAGNTKGTYLPNYGIIFHVRQDAFRTIRLRMGDVYRKQLGKYKTSVERIRQEQKETLKEISELKEEQVAKEEAKLAAKIYTVPVPDSDDDVLIWGHYGDENSEELIQREKKAIESIKTNVNTFFQKYAPSIGQLSPESKIAVLIDLNNWEIAKSKSPYLSAFAIRKDIDLFRKHQINSVAFAKRIQFSQFESANDIASDIDIMKEVFERGLDNISSFHTDTNNGIYLNGLGVIFFMEIPHTYRVFEDGLLTTVWSKNDDEETTISIMPKPDNKRKGVRRTRKNKTEDFESWRNNIEGELFDLIASYGHTLQVSPQESIILNVNFGERYFRFGSENEDPSRMILQLKKKDLDDYNSGKITQETLKKSLKQQTF